MTEQHQIAAEAYPNGHARPAPSEDEFDHDAINEAYEAYFDCTTEGSFGSIRAAIKVYNEMVARSSRADSRIAEGV